MMLTLTKEEYRELKKHGHLEKDGCVYSHLAKLDGETLAICERANDMDYIVEVKCEKVTACKINHHMLQYPRKGLWQ